MKSKSLRVSWLCSALAISAFSVLNLDSSLREDLNRTFGKTTVDAVLVDGTAIPLSFVYIKNQSKNG